MLINIYPLFLSWLRVQPFFQQGFILSIKKEGFILKTIQDTASFSYPFTNLPGNPTTNVLQNTKIS